MYAHWWEYNRDESNSNTPQEKIIVPVNKPEQFLTKSTGKSTPEAPAGKAICDSSASRSNKVQTNLMDGKAFKRNGIAHKMEEVIEKDNEQIIDENATVRIQIEEESSTTLKRGNERTNDETWKNYRSATKHAIKGCL